MIERWLRSYLDQFGRPVPVAAIDYARWAVCLIFVYKLLSRDFSLFGELPDYLLSVYPIDDHDTRYFHLMGCKVVVDLATLHFIYWFVDLPGPGGLMALQWAALASCAVLALVGRGPYRVFAILAFVLVMHLWGFMMRANHDLDDVEILQSLLLLYAFSRHRESLTVFRPRPDPTPTREAGRMYAVFLMAFVLYYLPSGANKLVDITLLDWFRYDYAALVERQLLAQSLGYIDRIPEFFRIFTHFDFANYIMVPMVYASHLATPVILWRRQSVITFAGFYAVFHLMTWGVSILFFGNILAWLAVLPAYRLFQPWGRR